MPLSIMLAPCSPLSYYTYNQRVWHLIYVRLGYCTAGTTTGEVRVIFNIRTVKQGMDVVPTERSTAAFANGRRSGPICHLS